MKKLIRLLTALAMLAASSVGAAEYNLDQFLIQVERHSKDLKLARKDTELARAEKKEAIAGALPHVSAQADYTRNLSDIYMYIDMGEGSQKLRYNRDNEYAFVAVLRQTLFSPALHYAITAAKQYEQLTDFVYDASYQEIIIAAKKAFYQAVLLHHVWQVTEASRQNALENYESVKNKYDNGLVSEFELLQAEVRYKDFIPRTTEARRNYDIALINLKNIAGIPVDQELIPVGSLDNYPGLPADVSISSILANRPDYNSQVWEAKLYETGVKYEKSNYYPSLSGNFAYAYSSQTDGWGFEDENNSYTVGVTLSIPIFTGGATRAKVQQARIEYDKSRIRVERAEDDINREIANIRLRLDEAFNRIMAAEATLKTAEKAFAIAEATSGSGLTTQLELKDSRLMLDQASVNYYSAIYEYLEAYYDWEKAIGVVRQDRN
ncbi:MAG: TolC family protein [Candidatus Zixiibacteriota bacterium]